MNSACSAANNASPQLGQSRNPMKRAWFSRRTRFITSTLLDGVQLDVLLEGGMNLDGNPQGLFVSQAVKDGEEVRAGPA
jgi:hypothetical protein